PTYTLSLHDALPIFPLTDAKDQPAASFMVRGYDVPPIAVNVGYLAALAAWETTDVSGSHALRLAVSTSGVIAVLASAVEHDFDRSEEHTSELQSLAY